jgi:hypothetical protein
MAYRHRYPARHHAGTKRIIRLLAQADFFGNAGQPGRIAIGATKCRNVGDRSRRRAVNAAASTRGRNFPAAQARAFIRRLLHTNATLVITTIRIRTGKAAHKKSRTLVRCGFSLLQGKRLFHPLTCYLSKTFQITQPSWHRRTVHLRSSHVERWSTIDLAELPGSLRRSNRCRLRAGA